MIHPRHDWVLVERITETVSAGGIHLPATFAGSRSAKLGAKADHWKARVVAVGPEAHDLEPGDVVLVHTWAAGEGRGLYAGVHAGEGLLFVRYGADIVCALEPDPIELEPDTAPASTMDVGTAA